MKENEDRFFLMCQILNNIANNDTTIERGDLHHHKWKSAKLLWEELFEPHAKDLEEFLNNINRYSKKDDKSG